MFVSWALGGGSTGFLVGLRTPGKAGPKDPNPWSESGKRSGHQHRSYCPGACDVSTLAKCFSDILSFIPHHGLRERAVLVRGPSWEVIRPPD